MRLFVAVEIPEPLHLPMSELQQKLKPSRADVTWTIPKQAHITLKFIGEVGEENLPKIEAIVKRAAGQSAAAEIEIVGAGSFPPGKAPKVVWIGARDSMATLRRVAAAIEKDLVALGYTKDEHAFEPHLTLGRVRGSKVGKLAEAVQSHGGTSIGTFLASEIVLFRSDPSRGAPIYTALTRAKLTGKDPR